MAALCVGGEARPDSVAIMLDEKYQPAMRGMQRRLYCLGAAVLSLMSITVILIALVSLSHHPPSLAQASLALCASRSVPPSLP